MNRWSVPMLRQAAALLGAGALALVAACGGGGSSTAPTGTPGATPSSFSQGPISGFGSVIVNGVRWDDSSATVTDDDGVSHDRSALKLGMVVSVDGSSVDHASGSGHAVAFQFGSETLGPITSIDATASTMVVLGLTAEVTTSTVFDSSITGGLAGLAAGDVVEIFGLFDAANNRVVATRVEKKTGVTEYRLRGTVAGLDSTGKTFTLGGETIAYGSASNVPATLANGVQVKVKLQTTQVGGAWVANKVRLILREAEDRSDAEVEGVISAWTSATSFEVNGLVVDATNASFPEGSTGVVLGAHVEIKGAGTNGVLVATVVHVEGDDHHGGGGQPKEFELHGAISNVDSVKMTFALRGLTVSYAGSVGFEHGSAAGLVNGAKVEVKGTLSADLTIIDATRIKFE